MKNLFERFLIGAMALICLSGNAYAQNIRIAVYGDSLTAGYQLSPGDSYAIKLEKKLKDIGYQNVSVVNLSVAGETTAGGLERISSIQVQHPDIVLLELGANDAIRGIGITLVNNNLGYIIGKLQQLGMEVILFGVKAPPNMGSAYVDQFAAVYDSLARREQVALVPDILDGINGNPSLTLADGFHPNSAGVDLMVENTFRAVDGGLRAKWNQIQMKQYEQGQSGGAANQGAQPGDVIGPTGVPPEER